MALKDIRQLLEHYNLKPKHQFGQNFMHDDQLCQAMVGAVGSLSEQKVLEVGPGTGQLTTLLLKAGAQVTAIEADHDLFQLLSDQFSEPIQNGQLILHHADALQSKHALQALILDWIDEAQNKNQAMHLVSNLPYNIATPLLMLLLEHPIQTMTFTVQKEVAQRLVALPDQRSRGSVSVKWQLLGQSKILRSIPAECFYPKPKVESALLRWERQVENDSLDLKQSFKRIDQLFAQPRQSLGRILRQHGGPAPEDCGLSSQARPQSLSLEDIENLLEKWPLSSAE